MPHLSERALPPQHTQEIVLHGYRLHLSPVQAQLLSCLLAQQGTVVSHETLVRQSYGCTWENTLTNRLRKNISQIRSVIEPHGLTLHSAEHRGYILLTEEPFS